MYEMLKLNYKNTSTNYISVPTHISNDENYVCHIQNHYK
jgi:hypothetical protein